MKLVLALLPVICLAVPATLYAAAPNPATTKVPTSATAAMPKSPLPPFAKADANHDGKISWSEAKALGVPQKIFKQDDFDNSGTLNQTELMFVSLDMTDFGPPAATTSAPAAATGR
ncbi:MAG: hypothetical protein ACRESR_02605 [Gammaproteobacteria bacterium]